MIFTAIMITEADGFLQTISTAAITADKQLTHSAEQEIKTETATEKTDMMIKTEEATTSETGIPLWAMLLFQKRKSVKRTS